MKKLITLALAVLAACAGTSAQYCSTVLGQTLTYRQTDTETKTDDTYNAVVVSVDRADNGVVSTRLEEKHAVADNIFGGEIVVNKNFSYNPADSTTTAILMNADDFKKFILESVKEMMSQAGQFLGPDKIAEISDAMKTSGELSVKLNPNAAVDSKMPNAKLSCTLDVQSMDIRIAKGLYKGFEEIETPAGKFNCIKITYVVRNVGMSMSPDEYVTAWYAEGVGLVREVTADKKGNLQGECELTAITNPAE